MTYLDVGRWTDIFHGFSEPAAVECQSRVTGKEGHFKLARDYFEGRTFLCPRGFAPRIQHLFSLNLTNVSLGIGDFESPEMTMLGFGEKSSFYQLIPWARERAAQIRECLSAAV